MEWYFTLFIILGALILLFLSGFPVAFCFMLINIGGAILVVGGSAGLHQLMINMVASINKFTLLSLPLFILMGVIIFEAGIARRILDVLEMWTPRIPGSLGLVTVAAGALFGTMSGSTMASASVLGTSVLPEMIERGYKKPIALGSILGSGGLAMIIPPSGIGIVLAAVTSTDIAQLFMAGLFPGFLMAALYAVYIVVRCKVQPHMAPVYKPIHIAFLKKIKTTLVNAIPLILIVFSVLGVIFLGIATPSESAAIAVFCSLALAAAYKCLTWKMIKNSLLATARITTMTLMILLGASAFSQLLGFTGILHQLTREAANLPVPPMVLHITMLFFVLILGCFIDTTSQIMLVSPIFMPVVMTLGIDPLWFVLTMLMTFEIGSTSPPFGMSLFVMKGIAPSDVSMGDIYRAAFPFILCDVISIALVLIVPAIALWLPRIM